MNKHQITGAAKDLAGKVQQEAGKLLGSMVQETKGIQKQVMGKTEMLLGDAIEIAKDAKDVIKGVVHTR